VSLGFYFDEQVPDPVTDGLRLRGVDVLTVEEDRFRAKPDTEILNRAFELGRVVFTQDAHFVIEGCRRQRAGQPFSGVIYGYQMKCTVGQLVLDLELIAKTSSLEEYRNRVEFLPL
jgi:hypothetical protein